MTTRIRVRTFPRLPADPLSFWQRLHSHPRWGFYFGSGAGTPNDRWIFCSATEPSQTWTSERGTARSSIAALSAVEERLRPRSPADSWPRYVGVLGFEAHRGCDPGLARLPFRPDPLHFPTAQFADFRAVVALDLTRGSTHLIERGLGFNPEREKLIAELLAERTTSSTKRKSFSTGAFRFPRLPAFSRKVLRAQAAIRAGDIYQANLSLRFSARFRGNPVDYYRALCRRNPSPYAALWKSPDFWIASASPELLLRADGSALRTRPIAGTRPRGRSVEEDRRKRGQLLLSPKERAEHIMLVDLERNDVGRVARPGSVRVPERFSVERYSHVMHIVSEVVGTLGRGRTAADALRSLFPGGTITGCPKIRSTEIIEEIESVSRGPFYGSAGFFCGNGDAVFNILIRTALIQRGQIHVQAGAGIVADSRALREYREIKAKAAALVEAAGHPRLRR